METSICKITFLNNIKSMSEIAPTKNYYKINNPNNNYGSMRNNLRKLSKKSKNNSNNFRKL